MYPIVCVAGGSCSGKTTFVAGFKNAIILSLDHFYKDISHLSPQSDGRIDFDTPDALDLEACKNAAVALSNGQDVEIPVYDYVSCKRTGTQIIKAPTEQGTLIVVEGLFTLCPPIHQIGMMRIYIEAPPEICVARRMKRDIGKGRSVEETLQWFVNVQRGQKNYVEPSKKNANLIVPFSYSPIVFAESDDYKV